MGTCMGCMPVARGAAPRGACGAAGAPRLAAGPAVRSAALLAVSALLGSVLRSAGGRAGKDWVHTLSRPPAMPKIYLTAGARKEHNMSYLFGAPGACRVTLDAREAAAVVVNPRWDMRHNNSATVPHEKMPGQRWVLSFFFEAPIYQGLLVAENHLMMSADRIDWTMTYMGGSTFHQPIGWKAVPLDGSLEGRAPMPMVTAQRPGLLLWHATNDGKGKALERGRILTSIIDAVRDVSPGLVARVLLVGKVSGIRDPCKTMDGFDSVCVKKRVQDFKFYFAAENSMCDGYITEKIFNSLGDGAVPLVVGGLGRSDYERVAPPRSFIHVDDFSSANQLVSYLLYLDSNSTAYAEYHAWRQTHQMQDWRRSSYSELCAELRKPLSEQRAPQFVGNVSARSRAVKSFMYDSRCRKAFTSWDSHGRRARAVEG